MSARLPEHSTSARNDYMHPHIPDLTGQIRLQDGRPSSYGGQADVYLAFWDRPDGVVNVAVKAVRMISDPDGRITRRFQREIAVWRRLSHPNVQPLLGLYSNLSPLPAMISQWHSNGDIVRYVKSLPMANSWSAWDTRYRLLTEVMAGLTYLHSNLVVHGDLKSANVLIADNGAARLCDFGLSAMLTQCSVTFSHQTLNGTCRWMAPELLADDDTKHTMLSDIWAVGGLLIEVIGGVLPYHTKKNDQQVILALSRQERPAKPRSMSSVEWELIEGCFECTPGDRPPADVILAQLKLQRMLVAIDNLNPPSDDGIRVGTGAIVALVHRSSTREVGLHKHSCLLIDWYSMCRERNTIRGSHSEELVPALWTLLYKCIAFAANGRLEFSLGSVENTASVVIRTIHAIGPPFNPPHALRSLNLKPLKEILSYHCNDILQLIADWPSRDPELTPLYTSLADVEFPYVTGYNIV